MTEKDSSILQQKGKNEVKREKKERKKNTYFFKFFFPLVVAVCVTHDERHEFR